MFNKQNRKSFSFLTPQSQRLLPSSSQTRLSLSSKKDENSQRFFENLISDPVKRALLMQVLSQDNLTSNNSDEKKEKSLRKKLKFKYESPSSLYRRRALEKMQEKEKTPNHCNTIIHAKKVPFDQILKGVCAYVEIKSYGEDRSSGAKALMQAMGAKIKDVLSRDITHVVFKDGCFKTFQKAKMLKIHLVSVLWIEATRKNMYCAPEKDYPALGASSSNANTSLLCKQFQKEYADLIQDELEKSQLSDDNINTSFGDDIIDTSQHSDALSRCSMKTILKPKNSAITPTSLFLDSTPDVTSDSDSEISLLKKISNMSRNHQEKLDITKEKDNNEMKENKDIDSNSVNKILNMPNNSSQRTFESEALSPLRISDGVSNFTPPNKIPQYDNVTQRRKRADANKSINILENHIIQPNIIVDKEINANRNVTANLYENINSSFENLFIKNNSEEKNENDINFKANSHKRRSVRKLYNPNESLPLPKSKNNDIEIDHVETENSKSNSVNRVNLTTKQLTTPTNKRISNVRKCVTTPSRKSTRISKINGSIDSPPKRNRLNSLENCISENNSDNNVTKEKSNSNDEANTNADDDGDTEFDENETSKIHLKIIKSQKPNVKITSRRKSVRLSNLNTVNHNLQKLTQKEESPNKKVRRSSLDFIPKENVKPLSKPKKHIPSAFDNTKVKLTQQKSIKKASIVCTRFHSTEVQVFQQIVKKLGGFLVEDEVTEKTTHLVAAEPRRTINLLRAIARGCWIVKSEWLYRSLEENHWLPEEDYELCEFSDAVQKARQERQAFGPRFSMDIFSNCGNIYISKATNPRCSDLRELVALCKGNVTTILRNADIVVGEHSENKQCVAVNWIMDCITLYKRKSLKSYKFDPQSSD